MELTEKSPEKLEKEIDQIFRLRSSDAEQKKLLKDALVNVLTKKLKDEILRQGYLNPIEYRGKKVLVMRELPRQVILERKSFR